MTAVNPEPRAPGEIGWPADADHPHDPSVPEPGSGGAHAEDMPEVSPPTIVDVEADEPAPEDAPAVEPEPEPAPVVDDILPEPAGE